MTDRHIPTTIKYKEILDIFNDLAIVLASLDEGESFDDAVKTALYDAFLAGYEDGFSEGDEQGYDIGDADGYQRGYEEGYQESMMNADDGDLF